MSTREALIELLKVIEKGGGALALSQGVDPSSYWSATVPCRPALSCYQQHTKLLLLS